MNEERWAEKAIDKSLSHTQRVTMWLQQFGQQEVSFDIGTLAAGVKLATNATYQALYQLERRRQIEILKQGGRIYGARLLKMESPSTTLKAAVEKANELIGDKRIINVTDNIPMLLRYIDQKLTAEKARKMLMEIGVDGETVNFPVNDFAEEGILLLNDLVKTHQKMAEMTIELDAAKRDNEFLSGTKKMTREAVLA